MHVKSIARGDRRRKRKTPKKKKKGWTPPQSGHRRQQEIFTTPRNMNMNFSHKTLFILKESCASPHTPCGPSATCFQAWGQSLLQTNRHPKAVGWDAELTKDRTKHTAKKKKEPQHFVAVH
uniref:Uncharacterized protein n=1 Tax=Trypanosoma congolense (strain IL3000) TaxID=1068625 RepID=G0UTM2_TRYCI|nr:hypothetical protein, unlikely [Trypanosoma congolense IL3000]